jgi:O-antigen/teichoic acid export membrane protein
MNLLIQKLNDFFRVDIKKILERAGYLLGGQLFGNLMSFLVALATAHFISKEAYGTYRYILSTVILISAFSLSGLGTAIVRSTARGYDNLFRTSFTKSMLWSLPAIIVGIGIGCWYFIHGNNILGISMIIGGILFPCIQSLLLYKSYLNGKNLFKALMVTNIAYSFATSGTLLVTLFFHPSVIALVIAYYVSNSVITAFIAYRIRKKFHPNRLEENADVTLAEHLSLMNILDAAATQLDKIILFQVAGPIEVARYTFATIFPEQLRNILKYIPTLSMPAFSALPENIARRKALQLIGKLFIITIPLVILYIIVAPIAFKLLFPAYTDVIRYSQVFALILIVDGGIGGTFLKAQNEVRSLYWVNLSANVIKIALLFGLGFVWGIWGIIASRIISRVLSFLITNILVRKAKIS